ncbi:hypothetical protein PJI16_12035 [Nitrospira sp. MA-1]|nr:hypothetical protein [Nitrospira sp. MA-1]
MICIQVKHLKFGEVHLHLHDAIGAQACVPQSLTIQLILTVLLKLVQIITRKTEGNK